MASSGAAAVGGSDVAPSGAALGAVVARVGALDAAVARVGAPSFGAALGAIDVGVLSIGVAAVGAELPLFGAVVGWVDARSSGAALGGELIALGGIDGRLAFGAALGAELVPLGGIDGRLPFAAALGAELVVLGAVVGSGGRLGDGVGGAASAVALGAIVDGLARAPLGDGVAAAPEALGDRVATTTAALGARLGSARVAVGAARGAALGARVGLAPSAATVGDCVIVDAATVAPAVGARLSGSPGREEGAGVVALPPPSAHASENTRTTSHRRPQSSRMIFYMCRTSAATKQPASYAAASCNSQ